MAGTLLSTYTFNDGSSPVTEVLLFVWKYGNWGSDRSKTTPLLSCRARVWTQDCLVSKSVHSTLPVTGLRKQAPNSISNPDFLNGICQCSSWHPIHQDSGHPTRGREPDCPKVHNCILSSSAASLPPMPLWCPLWSVLAILFGFGIWLWWSPALELIGNAESQVLDLLNHNLFPRWFPCTLSLRVTVFSQDPHWGQTWCPHILWKSFVLNTW